MSRYWFGRLKIGVVKVLAALGAGPGVLPWILWPCALTRALTGWRNWPALLVFRRTLGCADGRAIFLVNFYLRGATDSLFGMLLAETPGKFLPALHIEGQEQVRALAARNHGVLVLASHGGPSLLQSFLFRNVFHLVLGSYSATRPHGFADGKPVLKRDRLVRDMPLYIRGQERALLKGLLRGEWVNMLLDVSLPGRRAPTCRLAGRPVALSLFPFRISLKHGIPLLFVGISRPRGENTIRVRIRLFDGFKTPSEGLEWYSRQVEDLLREDPYANPMVPFWKGPWS